MTAQIVLSTNLLQYSWNFSKRHFGFFSGLLVLGILFVSSYAPASSAIFPRGDFLDSILVLNTLFATSVDLFDLSAELPTLLGGIQANALVFNDLDPTLWAYRFLDPFNAAVVIDSVSRLVGFGAVYALVHYFIRGSALATWSAAAAGLFFAMLPVLSSFAPSINFMALACLSILNIGLNQHRLISWSSLVLSTQFIGFVGAGFALLTLLILATLWQWIRGDEPRWRLLGATLAVTAGYLISLVRPAYLMAGGFVSHRTSWTPPPNGWFEPSTWRAARNAFVEVLTIGQIDLNSRQGGLPALLLAVLFSVLMYWGFYKQRSFPDALILPGKALLVVLGAILLVSVIYASELSTFTQLSSSLPVPISLYRVIVFFPMLWAMVLGFSAAIILNTVPKWSKGVLVFMLLILVLLQGVRAHPGINGKIQTFLGRDVTTLSEYYAVPEYEGLAAELGQDPGQLRVVSIGLDPMKAAFAGYSVFDGYLYNYPMEYKESFRKVIAPELEERNPELLASFDAYGSNLYMFQSGDPVDPAPRFDLCALQDLGAQYVLTPRDLELSRGYSLAAEYGNLRAYKIQTACPS